MLNKSGMRLACQRYTSDTVNSTREILEDNQIKLVISLDEQEFDEAVEKAFKRIAQEVRLPGFRPGKAPRKVLEARLGPGAGRNEAIQDAVPEYYVKALIEHRIDAIDSPSFEVTGGQDEGVLTFEAIVPVRPQIDIDDYESLEVEIPAPVATEEEVDLQVDAMREQFATLEEVDREIEEGDQVTIDIAGSYEGEEVEGLTTADYIYEVGTGAVVAEIDENLKGASVGDVVEFEAEHPDEEEEGKLSFQIQVKKNQIRVLPEVDDDFASSASEFETAEEMRSDIQKRMTEMKRAQSAAVVRDRIAQTLAEKVDIELPAVMIETEITTRIQDLAMRLQSQGLELERYLEAMGTDISSLREEFSQGADTAVKVDLALRSVIAKENLFPDDEKFEEYFSLLGAQMGADSEQAREMLTDSGRMLELEADLGKQAAIEWLYERAKIQDEQGQEINQSDLEPPEESVENNEDTEEKDTDTEGEED